MNDPYVKIEIGNIKNNNKFYIKKGIIIDKSQPLDNDCKILKYYDNGKYINTKWYLKEEKPDYTYDQDSKMWTLDGLNNKYECYFCEIPEDCLKWVNHLTDITVELTFNINDNQTLHGDGSTNSEAELFS